MAHRRSVSLAANGSVSPAHPDHPDHPAHKANRARAAQPVLEVCVAHADFAVLQDHLGR